MEHLQGVVAVIDEVDPLGAGSDEQAGQQVATRTVDTETGAGSLFGLLVGSGAKRIYFVDDGDNTLKVLH